MRKVWKRRQTGRPLRVKKTPKERKKEIIVYRRWRKWVNENWSEGRKESVGVVCMGWMDEGDKEEKEEEEDKEEIGEEGKEEVGEEKKEEKEKKKYLKNNNK